jgi:hypothetical protein
MLKKINPGVRSEIRRWSVILTCSMLTGASFQGVADNSSWTTWLTFLLCVAISCCLVMANNTYVARKKERK